MHYDWARRLPKYRLSDEKVKQSVSCIKVKTLLSLNLGLQPWELSRCKELS